MSFHWLYIITYYAFLKYNYDHLITCYKKIMQTIIHTNRNNDTPNFARSYLSTDAKDLMGLLPSNRQILTV